MSELRLESIQKIYGKGAPALQQIQLQVKEQEFLVLVGPSGCGKSTLLRVIAGLETPTEGKVLIAGRDVTWQGPSERNIGMVFQDYALYPHMSVRENLSFGLRMRGIRGDELTRRVSHVSGILELDPLLERRPAQLSGGQRQRVAIGRAMVKEPSLFLLDEPLSNLDPQLRHQMRVEIAALHRRIGSTTIYVTHDQEEAMTLADRIALINHGMIQQLGSPRELYERPLNRFTASFIGSPSMNFLEGALERGLDGEAGEDGSVGKKLFRFGNSLWDATGWNAPDRTGPIVLGIRPEAMIPIFTGGAVRLEILLIEYHGFELQVAALLEGERVLLRSSDPQAMTLFGKLGRGDQFSADFDRKGLHWFEPGSEGRRID